jgi:hypothetical protein
MLLPELIERHRSREGRVFAVSDPDYLGFGSVAKLGGESPAAGDLLLVDAGMTSDDPWAAIGGLAEGVVVAVAVPGDAADLPVGRIVQALSTAGYDLVQATDLENVYNRQVAAVGVRGGEPSSPKRIRRLAWEWACADLQGRALQERTRQVEEDLRGEIARLKGEVEAADAHAAQLEASLAEAQRTVNRIENSSALRLGRAVLRARRHPVGAVRDVSSEIMALRRTTKSEERS